MASSSGNSSVSGSSLLQNNSENLQVLMEQRKRKRMQSNRESARRSRMRKQKHLDDLMTQVSQLRKENNQILTTINVTTQHYLNLEAQNSILRAQLMELGQRLDSLIGITNAINATMCSNTNNNYDTNHNEYGVSLMNTMNLVYLNQPIMASPDLFQY